MSFNRLETLGGAVRAVAQGIVHAFALALTAQAQSPAREAPQRWRIVAERPRLRLVQSEKSEFDVVMGATMLANGDVVVASDMRNQLQWYAPSGRFLRAVGRRGQGPSEFEGISSFWRTGDSVVVFDMRGVGQVFDAHGRFVRSIAPTARQYKVHGVLGDGSRLVGWLRSELLPLERWAQAREDLLMLDPTPRTVLTATSQELFRSKTGRLQGNVFAARNRVATFPDGFCTGYAGGIAITCYAVNGAKQASIELDGARNVAVTSNDQEEYFNDIYAVNPLESKSRLDAQVRALRERVTFAKTMGYFGEMRPSRDGQLWVGPPSTDDWRPTNPNPAHSRPGEWRVYSRSGQWVAIVTLPARFSLLETGADYVLGVLRDADDREEIVVYALMK